MSEADKRLDALVDNMEQIMNECREKIGPDAEITREDYEVAVIEAYVLMCNSYKDGVTSAVQIVAFGFIFDMVHTILDLKYGPKKEVNQG